MIRVLIIEDHPIVRRGLKEVLSDEYPKAVFGEASDSQTALEQLHRQEWDMALLDINIPGHGGLKLLEEARQLRSRMYVLVVSTYPEEEFALRALKLGAAGYLSKNQAPDELVTAVKKILAGGKYITASLAERLAGALESGAHQAPHERLSARELQVLSLIARGKTIKAIAAELTLSEKTIATYRTRIAEKTGLSTNVELTRYAFHHGLTQ